jgi:serine/threonine protein kinase
VSELRRADLPSRTRALLHRGRARNPDVLLVATDDGLAVVKDFAQRGAFVRRWVAPWLNRREIRAYETLAGHPAVPRLLGRVDALAFVLEHRPGRRMSRRLAGTLPAGFIDRLAAAVDAMHARGVVHLDLRHRSNVLVDDRGDPVLIDFASALVLAPGSALARVLARLDRNAVEKWRQRVEPTPSGVSSAKASSADRRGASRPT